MTMRLAAKRGQYVSCCFVKAPIPLPRVHTACWLWVVLVTVLLSSSVAYSVKDNLGSEEGKCRYDLTSIAALSCVQPDADSVSRSPSQSCCNALLYAIDQVPPNDVTGACCLCRYLKEKQRPSGGLATAYVLCNGKDKDIISKWSLFPIRECSKECTKRNNSSVNMGTSANEDSPVVRVHSTGKGIIWISVAVFIVMGVICFWYSRRVKEAAKNASAQRRASFQVGDSRRSVAPSSSAKTKGRRFSSS